MVPFGTDETISRIVEEYSPMLLRLACTRLEDTAATVGTRLARGRARLQQMLKEEIE